MPLRLKALFGVAGTAVVLLIALACFFYFLITKSFPQSSGSIDVSGISAPAAIYRDDYGVPHIFAGSDYDAYFSVGYVHAQDRLWQMELIRRAGQGRLSEILGERTLKIDKMFCTLGLWPHAQNTRLHLDPMTRAQLQAYADGVNEFIQSHKGKYPVEFDVLDCDPEPWIVEHSLLISRLMAWELNYSRWVDVVLATLVERLGAAKASEIFPTWPDSAPFTVSAELKGKQSSSLATQLLEGDLSFKELLGSPSLESGSNAWAIAGSKSTTGKPILANDPHLLYSAPGRWYELHVSAPGLDVSGTSIAGIPFVIIGRNQSIAWGVTNAMLDDEDFFVEEVDSVLHPSRYRFNNAWRAIEQRVDTILVKNSPPVFLSVYKTHRGPIVNRMEPSAQFSRQLLSMRWVGHEITNEARAFSMMNRARTWKEFLAGLQHFGVPAQNFVYADVQGNIGYHMGGRIPIRKSKGPTLISPGWTEEHDWKGFVPFDQMPHTINPPEGFVATANNKIISDSYPYYLSSLWEPEWRIERIREVLRGRPLFSMDDMQRLQQDVVSPHAREIVPVVLRAYDGQLSPSADVQTSLAYFRNWNFEMKTGDVATSLFQSFLLRMVHNTFEDEMGSTLLSVYDTVASVPLMAIAKLMKKGSSSWFDNVTTPGLETMNDVIKLSLDESIGELRRAFGGEIKEWRWGSIHQVQFRHVFSEHPMLRPIFTVGPFPMAGSHSTINKGDYPLRNPFTNTVGPSTRQIFDLSDLNNTRSVTPPGQSGQVFQRHYDDQVRLWLNGLYRRQTMDRAAIEKAGYEVLTLQPRR